MNTSMDGSFFIHRNKMVFFVIITTFRCFFDAASAVVCVRNGRIRKPPSMLFLQPKKPYADLDSSGNAQNYISTVKIRSAPKKKIRR